MATEKDTAIGDLESLNDVFADIMNVLIFDGDVVVLENDLEQGREKSSYESGGKVRVRPQFRDVHKRWMKNLIAMSYVGLENETDAEDDMAFRVIGYDGASNLFEIAFLDDDVVKKFKSDFRIVAEYLVQMRKDNDYNLQAGDSLTIENDNYDHDITKNEVTVIGEAKNVRGKRIVINNWWHRYMPSVFPDTEKSTYDISRNGYFWGSLGNQTTEEYDVKSGELRVFIYWKDKDMISFD